MPELAEECRAAAEKSQVLITSHSPFFLNAMQAEEVRVLYRDESGFTQAVKASDIQGIPEMMEAGGSLGYLWMEGHFGMGDPLVNPGAPQSIGKGAK
ncbi:AAA family ATPase [Desulfoplanes sp.]